MLFIFDFDGTLVDNFETAIDIFIQLADEFHFRKINKEESEHLKDFTSQELLKYLKIPIYKIPIIIQRAKKLMHTKIHELLPTTNLIPVLKQLHDEKNSLAILTSNSLENVTTWLKVNKINHLFNHIHADSYYFGKRLSLKKLLKQHQTNPSNILYLGDESRDIEAAKQNGIYSVAVTWGFNSEKVLLKCHPHYIVRSPEEILVLNNQSLLSQPTLA
jgi:phosphoglycolate phosphatase